MPDYTKGKNISEASADDSRFGVAAEKLGEVKEDVSNWYQTSRGTARRMGNQVAGYIQRYPLYSLCAAIGTGFLVGMISKQSHK